MMREAPAPGASGQKISHLEQESSKQKQPEKINQVLFNISQAICMASDLNGLFESVHSILGTIMDTTNFLIALWNHTNQSLTVSYHADSRYGRCVPDIDVVNPGSLPTQVIQKGYPLMVTTEQISGQQGHNDVPVSSGKPTGNWLGVPLKTLDHIIGVMVVQSHHDPVCYNQTDQEILVSVANQTAVAIGRIQAEQILKERDDLLQEVLENSLDVSYRLNLMTRSFDYFSPVLTAISGYTAAALKTLPQEDTLILIHPDDRPDVTQVIDKALSGPFGIVYQIEYRFKHRDGHYFRILDQFKVVGDETGQPTALIGSVRDISERSLAKEKLLVNEKIIMHSSSAIAACDLEGNMTFGNPFFQKLWGFRDSEAFLGRPFTDFWLLGDEQENIMKAIWVGGTWMGSIKAIKQNGTLFDVQVSAAMVYDGNGNPVALTSTSIDITENKRTEEALRSAIHEKNVLLREVHHRVKNNMQIIISLLGLQSEKLENEHARQAIVVSQQRIYAIAMIHEALYCNMSLSSINLDSYTRILIVYLQQAYNSHRDIDIVLDIDNIRIDTALAVACGLIINELITNALKHAFHGVDRKVIRIEAHHTDSREVMLKICDNGVGLPAGFNIENRSSLGLRLVQELVKRQLKGSLNVAVSEGTCFTIRWPIPLTETVEA